MLSSLGIRIHASYMKRLKLHNFPHGPLGPKLEGGGFELVYWGARHKHLTAFEIQRTKPYKPFNFGGYDMGSFSFDISGFAI